MSVAQVKRMLDKIEELGLVSRDTEVGKSTTYTLLEPEKRHLDEEDVENLAPTDPAPTELPPSSTRATPQLPQSYKGTNINELKEGSTPVHKKYSSIDDVTVEDCNDISANYHVSVGFVQLQLEKLRNYCESKGKRYKNYKSALRNFVIGDMQRQIERRSNDPKSGIDARGV
jgi:hypothetical protein